MIDDDRPFVTDHTQAVTQLPVLHAGKPARANAINRNGVICGWAKDNNDNFRPVIWAKDSVGNYRVYELPTLGGSMGSASDINDNGAVVGWSTTNLDAATHASVWDASVPSIAPTDLGVLMGWTDSYASGVNASGDVVGSLYDARSTHEHAMLYTNSTMYDIDPTNAGCEATGAFAINSTGLIVGWSISLDHGIAPLLWTSELPMQIDGLSIKYVNELNPFTKSSAITFEVNDLNDAGHVAGMASFYDPCLIYNRQTRAARIDFICASAADTDGDGCVFDSDYINVMLDYDLAGGTYSGYRGADLDHSCTVDDAELLLIITNFGRCCK